MRKIRIGSPAMAMAMTALYISSQAGFSTMSLQGDWPFQCMQWRLRVLWERTWTDINHLVRCLVEYFQEWRWDEVVNKANDKLSPSMVLFLPAFFFFFFNQSWIEWTARLDLCSQGHQGHICLLSEDKTQHPPRKSEHSQTEREKHHFLGLI